MNIIIELIVSYWYMFVVYFIVLWLKSPRGKGAVGELFVNGSTKLMLDPDRYRIFTDVTLPTKDGTTQIDQIIVSRYGIFVVETKHYSGWIFGSAEQKTWTQKFPRSSFKFQNPLHQNYKHVRTLGELLSLDTERLFSVVVFIGEYTFKTSMPPNVTNTRGMYDFVKSKTHMIFTQDEVVEICDSIESGRLERSRKTNREHIKHVKKIISTKGM